MSYSYQKNAVIEEKDPTDTRVTARGRYSTAVLLDELVRTKYLALTNTTGAKQRELNTKLEDVSDR